MFDAMDVRRHGGRGNGTDDDSPAIARAMIANRGGDLYLAPGTWRVTDPRVLGNYSGRIFGAAPGATKILYAGDPDEDAITFERRDDPTALTTTGCGLSRLTLQGPSSGSGHGIVLESTLYARLDDVVVTGFGGAGICFQALDGDDPTVSAAVPLQTVLTNVVSYQNGHGLLHVGGTTLIATGFHAMNNSVANITINTGGSLQFIGGSCQGAVPIGIHIAPPSAAQIALVTFDGMHIEGNFTGGAAVRIDVPVAHPNNAGCKSITFRSCYMSTAAQSYVYARRVNGITLENCDVIGAGSAYWIDAEFCYPLYVLGGALAGNGWAEDLSDRFSIANSLTQWRGGADQNLNAIGIGNAAPLFGTLSSKFKE
jgi:hypothetical protein